MGCIEKSVSSLSRFISWLNWVVWWLASWLSISDPKIDSRMKFYDDGTVEWPAEIGLSQQEKEKLKEKKEKLPDQKKVIKSIYALLGILDKKASALMRYNGIILAVVSLFIRMGTEQRIHGLDLAIMLITLFSIMLCLLVVGIFWRFLELAFPASGTTNVDYEVSQLKCVLHLRETSYQLAWLLAVVVTFLLAIRFILHS